MDGTKGEIAEKYKEFLALKAKNGLDTGNPENDETGKTKESTFSRSWKEVEEQLKGEDERFNFLIYLLSLGNDKYLIRNKAAVTLGDEKEERAVDPLFNAILKKENINYNGSMVFALESLSCGYKFKELFEILFHHGYEAKLHAYNILCEQKFAFDNDDLIQLQMEWEEIKLNPELCLCFDDARDMIQNALDMYLVYLEK